jgi:hypothetical protein
MLLLIDTQQCYYQTKKMKQDMEFGFGIHKLK